eukprot:8550597-Pyramimonas_sp.AAC.1
MLGRAARPSTAPPGKFNDAVQCNLTFILVAFGCIRYGAGIECWMQFGPAKVPYSDEEGAVNNDTAQTVLQA